MIELAFVSIQVCTAKLYTLYIQTILGVYYIYIYVYTLHYTILGVPIYTEINVGIESSFHLRGIKFYLSDLKIRKRFTQLQEIFFQNFTNL